MFMRAEVVFVVAPLLLLLLGVSAYEIRTGLIKDVVTLPGLLYMLVVRALIGPDAWFKYLLAALLLVVGFVLLSSVPRLFGRDDDWIGFGAVKLLGVVGAAVGLSGALWVALGFIAGVAVAMLVTRAVGLDFVPSSPIIGLVVVALLLLRVILTV
ncbi:MAG TPA: prepilin peptidase [Thermoanaerobaculia bacterium]|nr:prepilin peptidase [Thermoanaerobaculia bacterium]